VLSTGIGVKFWANFTNDIQVLIDYS
jgi:hypothetical protein